MIEDKIFLIFKKISNFIGRQLLQDPFYRENHLEYYKINGYEDAKGYILLIDYIYYVVIGNVM